MVGAPVNFECQSIQADLDRFFAQNLILANRSKTNALIAFLKSPQNRAGVQMLQDNMVNADGTRLKMRLRTEAATCYELLKGAWDCNAPVRRKSATPYEHVVELSDNPYYLVDPSVANNPAEATKPVVFSWDFTQWKTLCINQKDFFQRKLAQALINIEENINRDLMTQIAAAAGKFNEAGNITEKQLPLFVPNTTSVLPVMNPYVDQKIREAYNIARITGKFAVLGGTDWWNYAEARKLQDASQWGYNISKSMQPYESYYDLDAAATLGAGVFYTIPFGAVQLVNYCDNKGNGFIDYPDSKKFTVFTPSGIEVDVWWNHNTANRCNQIDVGFSVYAELAVVPANNGCNVLDGVNGLFKYTNCNSIDPTTIVCP
jgi:hypothetical protein